MTPNPAFSMDDFAKALDQYDYQFEKGQIVRGRVNQTHLRWSIHRYWRQILRFYSFREISLENVISIAEALPIGAEFDFLITRGQDAEGESTYLCGNYYCKKLGKMSGKSLKVASRWQLRVTGANKGGVTGEVEGLKGFIPRSHLIEMI